MFRYLLNRSYFLRNASTTAPKEQWDLCVSVLIERLPIVSKKFNEIESEFKKTLSEIELENSLKSDHEIRKEKDKIQQDMIKAGKMEIELDSAQGLQTAQDFEDLNQEELSKFKFGVCKTEEDKNNNLLSLDRKLDETLILMLEQNINRKAHMLLPQVQWNEGETLRQTAERIVQEKVGSDFKIHFYGNAPCGFYKYKYNQTEKKDKTVGAKVFFYRAAYKSGEVVGKTFEWVNEEELKSKVRTSYYQSVSQFLIS